MSDQQRVSIRRIIGNVVGNLGISNINAHIDDFARWSVDAEIKIGSKSSTTLKECEIYFKNMRACLPKDLIRLNYVKYGNRILDSSGKQFKMFHKGPTGGGSTNLANTETYNINDSINTQGAEDVYMSGLNYEGNTLNLVYTLTNGYLNVNSPTVESVGISYDAVPVDDEGWPMIAYNHEDAVTAYLMWKYKSIEYFNGKLPHHIYKELEQRWYWLCGQARGDDEMPSSSELEYLSNQWNQLLPLPNRKFF